MKALTIMYLLSIGFCFGQTPPLNPFFEKYKDDDRFTQVYISGRMLNLISQFAEDDDYDDEDEKREMEAVKNTLDKLEGIRILSMDEEETSGGVISGNKIISPKALYREARDLTQQEKYEELMTVKEKDEEFLILIQENNGVVTELILIGYETEECCDGNSFFLLSLYGEIELRSISELGGILEIEELEKLEKLDEK
jgi:Domain of unknown function (DUF4252)